LHSRSLITECRLLPKLLPEADSGSVFREAEVRHESSVFAFRFPAPRTVSNLTRV